MFKYRSEKRDKYYGVVTEMYFKEGATITAISRKISTPRSTIWDWICNFAAENCIEMASKKYSRKSAGSPANGSVAGDGEEALYEEIRCLREELKRERLRADLNEEIINVAEQKFNIQIRKKAGAKR